MKTIRAFLLLARPFWTDRNRWPAWILLAAVVSCSLGFVSVSVSINQWNREFFDAVAAFDVGGIAPLLLKYLFFLFLIVTVLTTGNFLTKKLVFFWRDDMTDRFHQRWLGNQRHYRLQLSGEVDNPDQRIAEDLALLSEESINLFKNLVLNIARVTAFASILWNLSGRQSFEIAGISINLYGYLLWLALLYSVGSSIFIHLIGGKLRQLDVDRQHREADYRSALFRVRASSEEIAFYRGGPAERERLDRRFEEIRKNWRLLIAREFKVEIFSAAQTRIGWMLPIAFCLPAYLRKAMSFGEMMQAQNAFSSVTDGFGWFFNYYRRIIEWAAVVQRVAEFDRALEQFQDVEIARPGKNAIGDSSLKTENLKICTPSGLVLLDNLSFSIAGPQWVLLDGPSGIGKSTLLRVIAGHWPYYSGEARIGGNTLFLPQKPYLPEDTLRRVLSYPAAEPFSDIDLQRALRQVGMQHVGEWLDRHHVWQNVFSGGEQQRICIARVLLHRPDILVADEATNQLDSAAAVKIFKTLKRELPDLLVLGVTHQAAIKREFESILKLQ